MHHYLLFFPILSVELKMIFGQNIIFNKLVDFALGLVEGAPNSTGLERIFSTAGITYVSLRSRIGVGKYGKLAFLYRELNKSNKS